MTVEPQVWRIIADRIGASEAFIPIDDPRYELVMRRIKDGPSEEERVRLKKQIAKDEAKRLAEMQALRDRHEALVSDADSSLMSALLAQHAPRDVEWRPGKTYSECHGCPTYYDHDDYGDGGEQHHGWPCPTWQTISDSTA